MGNKDRAINEAYFVIDGMFCPNCQRAIEGRLRSMPGVQAAEADYVSGAARVKYDTGTVALEAICGAITELGYEVEVSRTAAFTRTVSLLVVIVGAYVLLQRFGVLNLLVPSRLADGGMGYGLLFLTGLASSVHCIAMCGGINLSQSLPGAEKKASRLTAFAPTALYNLGRVISYTVVGAVLGGAGYLLGGGVGTGVPVLLQGILKLLAGVMMVIMGVNMLGLFPGLRRVTARLPGLSRGRVRSSRPLVVGLLNGLMPCGPLQSVQIIALASGHPLVGALSMLAFSLGTVPLMLGLGAIVSALGQRFARTVMTVGAVLVTVLGLAMLSQGVSLSGLVSQEHLLLGILGLCLVGLAAVVPMPGRGAHIAVLAASVALILGLGFGVPALRGTDGRGISRAMEEYGIQVVYSTLESGSYPSIRVSAGVPVRWVIQAPAGSVNGCNYRMILREYGISHEFTEGENVIEFTPPEAGTVAYTCWMGMLHGTIYVE